MFIEAVKARFEHATTLTGSDPREYTTAYGPMADKAQFERVIGFIEKGKKDGEPIIGGNRKGTQGFFIEPTIFVDTKETNPIYKEEIFGPVLIIKTFKTEEEAIKLANDTDMGLSGEFA
jgi:aldehyde dehydrogenase (NAD+)